MKVNFSPLWVAYAFAFMVGTVLGSYAVSYIPWVLWAVTGAFFGILFTVLRLDNDTASNFLKSNINRYTLFGLMGMCAGTFIPAITTYMFALLIGLGVAVAIIIYYERRLGQPLF